jgi:hypothetical protein
MPDTELRQALSRLAATHADYAGLLAACRASLAAESADHPDPLVYVRALLTGRGQLPEPGASPLVVLADARTALNLTRQHAHSVPSRPVLTTLAGHGGRS